MLFADGSTTREDDDVCVKSSKDDSDWRYPFNRRDSAEMEFIPRGSPVTSEYAKESYDSRVASSGYMYLDSEEEGTLW
jgi:hypothetical protein